MLRLRLFLYSSVTPQDGTLIHINRKNRHKVSEQQSLLMEWSDTKELKNAK